MQHLLLELKGLTQAQPALQQQQRASVWEALQALLFACCGHPSNLQQLVDAGAMQQLAQGKATCTGGMIRFLLK